MHVQHSKSQQHASFLAMTGGDYFIRHAVSLCLKEFSDYNPRGWVGTSWKDDVLNVIGELMLEARYACHL